MSLLDKFSKIIPGNKKEAAFEYFFALNIGSEKLTAALWTIQHKKLHVLKTASDKYSSLEDINPVTDSLLDAVLGDTQVEPQKILFGVPDAWLVDENLKDEYLKILRKLVKELEITPMAYVATSHSLVHLLQKEEGTPTTAILVGFEKEHIEVIVSHSGRVEAAKLVERGSDSGAMIEKTLLSISVENLPSKMLLYGLEKEELVKLKGSLLSYPWMSKLSFLHFPKIEVLVNNIEIDSVCLAGASELEPHIVYVPNDIEESNSKHISIKEEKEKKDLTEQEKTDEPIEEMADFGFVVGDVGKEVKEDTYEENIEHENIAFPEETKIEEKELITQEDFAPEDQFVQTPKVTHKISKKIHISPKISAILVSLLLIFAGLIGAYIFIPKVVVKVYVEPKIMEKDAKVIADPKQDKVDEENKIIPAKIVETQASGNLKGSATGRKEIGDPAKGTVKIINNTDKGQNFPSGTIFTTSDGLKFKLDNSASVSATLEGEELKSTITASLTAVNIGSDGNLATGTPLSVGKFTNSQFAAKSEGNFSGGTSKEVTVVSSDDQKKLLALLSDDLRKKAQVSLQEKNPEMKVLSEALKEQVIKKTYSKNINDQASEFSLDVNAKYSGSAFDEKDLRLIVGKLVTTQVPEGYSLDLTDTETQADISEVDKDGKVIFLAKFKAKLIPKLDTESIKNQIKGKSIIESDNILKKIENVLGSEVQFKPKLPSILQRIPFIAKNITIEVGFK